jgi:hypothetical protein
VVGREDATALLGVSVAVRGVSSFLLSFTTGQVNDTDRRIRYRVDGWPQLPFEAACRMTGSAAATDFLDHRPVIAI